MSSAPSNRKVFKRGEVIAREGDGGGRVFFITSGSVSQIVGKGKKNVDIFQLSANSIIGELILSGQSVHLTTSIASTDTQVIEIPTDLLLTQFEAVHPMIKMVVKGAMEKLKTATTELKS